MSNDCAVFLSGVYNCTSAVVPRSLGIFPNAMTVTANLPQDFPLPVIGTLEIYNGGRTLQVNDVKFDFYSVDLSGRVPKLVVRLLDRRWRWPFLLVSGRYNVYQQDGEIDPETKYSLQELATVLLDAMYEQTYDVSTLPNDVYPSVYWDYATAAYELHALLERYGYDLSLNWDDTLSIVQLGVGYELPEGQDVNSWTVTSDNPEGPDQLVLLCGESLFQSRLKLIAVGKDTDGSIQRVEDLSYIPSGGWEGIADPAFFTQMAYDGKSRKEIELAKLSVFRWFMVDSQADGGMEVPGYGEVSDISQLFPLNNYLLDVSTAANSDKKIRNPARVLGKYLESGDPSDDKKVDEIVEYGGRFSIDSQTGVVKFRKLMLNYNDSNQVEAAELYLETSYGVLEDETLKNVREEFTYDLSDGGPLQEAIRAEELSLKTIAHYDGDDSTDVQDYEDNTDTLESTADSILQASALRYSQGAYAVGSYRFLQDINTDGAIRQVVISINDATGCFTRASRNTESFPGINRMGERRKRRIINKYSDTLTTDYRTNVLKSKGAYR